MQPRRLYSPRKTLAALAVLAVLVFYPYLRATRMPRAYRFGGETMGTFYSVRLAPVRLSERRVRSLQERVEERLRDINRQMSTYDPDSEISRFNAAPAGEPVRVSPEFAAVTEFALQVADRSGGAFDPTIAPLAALWGFGPRGEPGFTPSENAVRACLEVVNHRLVQATSDTALLKLHPDVRLDLNAVAKGYGVDAVAALLEDAGCAGVFVDIGGEVMAVGDSGEGRPWRVSVEAPVHDAALGATSMAVLELKDRAVATSGDYRNYYRAEGRAYAHILDPRIGRPTTNRVASVTVTADDCMTADALATALMVLGPADAPALLSRYPGTEAYIITRTPDGAYAEWQTGGFPR